MFHFSKVARDLSPCNLDVCYANATNEKKHCGSVDYLCQMAHAKADILYEIYQRNKVKE
jgi:hypothetical protein